MTLEQEIEGVRTGLASGRFVSEAAVSQGAVRRLLHALDWPTFDTEIVSPEHRLGPRRVDYALCHPANRAIALTEVKQVGQSDGAERQLFEYAFHEGIPMAILTDGREWNFLLPGEQGDYGERRVSKLDLVDRDLAECADRLRRYLLHAAVTSGAALQAARDDYRHVSRDRQMLATLPKAWSQIIADEDETLLTIVADRVENLCGFRPNPDVVAGFPRDHLASGAARPPLAPTVRALPPATPARRSLPSPAAPLVTAPLGLNVDGVFHPARNALDVLRTVLETLTDKDPSFPERFAALPKHGTKRRYLARNPDDLYPGRPDLCRDCVVQLKSGWWLGTNHSREMIGKIINLACDTARGDTGSGISFHLGKTGRDL